MFGIFLIINNIIKFQSPLDGQDSEDDGHVDFAALFKRGLDNLRVGK